MKDWHWPFGPAATLIGCVVLLVVATVLVRA